MAMLAGMQIADAQVKSPEAAKKALDSAIEASKNEKKATKVATWTKLAQSYMDAYNAPAGSAWLGASKQEIQLLMPNEKPVAVENAVLGGEPCTKEIYANKEFYFNPAGQLTMINVTKPVVENALDGALEAYKKAFEDDVKKSKVKDITAGIESIAKKYLDEGMNCYMLNDLAGASVLFEKAVEASAAEPLSKVDTTCLYNAGFTAWAGKNYERAKALFEKCLEVGYYYDGGEVFAKLADVNNQLGDKAKAKTYYEQVISDPKLGAQAQAQLNVLNK